MTDLTTLPHAKAWLAIFDNDAADVLLRRLITAASGFVLSYLERDTFDVVEREERYDGGGSGFMLLREAPVVEITALELDGVGTLTAYSNTGRGFRLADPEPGLGRQRLSLVNATFPIGTDNVRVAYTTGQVATETVVLPEKVGDETTVRYEPRRPFLTDRGAKKAGVAVAGYTVEDGVYVFPEAEGGETVTVSYSTFPTDIEQVVCEIVGEAYKRRDRIGQTSASLGQQQTIQFSTKDLNDFAKTTLGQFKRSAPL